MSVKCDGCDKTFSDTNKKAIHYKWKHTNLLDYVRKKHSDSMKRHIATLTTEQLATRMKKSTESVPKWNAGNRLPEGMKLKIRLTTLGKSHPNVVPRKLLVKVCPTCKNDFARPLKKKSQNIFCSKKCANIGIAQAVRRLHQDPIYKENYLSKHKSISPEQRKLISNTVKRWFVEHPEEAEANAQKSAFASPRRPTRPEIAMEKMLDSMFPHEYKYVGDGYTWIARANPDFMNVNGQKKLIEVYGDYWHKGEDPQVRIDHFAKYGFKTLVVWEHEFKEHDALVKRLENFHNEH